MKCDQCGVEARPKTITAKSGKTYSGYECQGGCKNPDKPQYAYFFFGHRSEAEKAGDSRHKGAPSPETAEVMALLREIVAILQDLRHILANPQRVHVTPDELEPDQEVPF